MSGDGKTSKIVILAVLVAGTVIGIAGIDLVLPAIPSLPGALGGSAASAQLVLASFAAGAGVGMLIFGRLGDSFDRGHLLLVSFGLYGLTSLLCALASNMETLIGLRFVQGAVGAAAAVFAPGIIRNLLEPARAVRAIGVMGSIEALVPALAPLLGVLLLERVGWKASFVLTTILAFGLTLATMLLKRSFPQVARAEKQGSYLSLLRSKIFLRYCVSHALVLGGLLTFVFGAPAVFVGSMNGDLSDFILMQVIGIASFIGAANSAQRMVEKFGAERMIMFGTCLAALSGLAILLYAVAVDGVPWQIIPLFVPMNIGLGLRGPPGFYRAVVAARGDDSRGSALVVLAILGTSSLGTAVAAPFIESGLPALAAVASVLLIGAVLVLWWLPVLEAPDR